MGTHWRPTLDYTPKEARPAGLGSPTTRVIEDNWALLGYVLACLDLVRSFVKDVSTPKRVGVGSTIRAVEDL